MTKLPPPEQWALCKLNEMEVAEMIERHIDFYTVDKNGHERSVHLPTPFVRHFMNRSDGVLPTCVAFSTMPLVLADGHLLAPPGFDYLRGIQFLIPDALRAAVPQPQNCTPERVKAAIQFLCDEWLVDVTADQTGKAILIAAALTLIERSLLEERPCFFVTAGRRGSGKSTAIMMLIMAVVGIMPAAAAWSTNEEERRKALLSHFIHGMPYILWDNIPRGLQISCPHIERSCTAAYYSDRRLGVSEIAKTGASTIHLFNGNNIGPKGDLASRSLQIRLSADRVDPENRPFKHSNPLRWTENHRADILAALYTVLLGNPQLKTSPDAEGKTRFKMWWRLIGSAVEHAAGLVDHEMDFQQLFLSQEEDDEEAASLADVLEVLARQWPTQFEAKDAAGMINNPNPGDDEQTVREFLLPGALPGHVFSAKSVGRLLKRHLEEPVRSGNHTIVLQKQTNRVGVSVYSVVRLTGSET